MAYPALLEEPTQTRDNAMRRDPQRFIDNEEAVHEQSGHEFLDTGENILADGLKRALDQHTGSIMVTATTE